MAKPWVLKEKIKTENRIIMSFKFENLTDLSIWKIVTTLVLTHKCSALT